MELTVAYVSGFIAAGVFILQMLVPLAIPCVLVAFLSQENTVMTWTVLGRFLHSSLWPTILGTSTAATAGVRWRVYLSSWLQIILLFIISVASICSPLGLYSSVEPEGSPTAQPFHYVRDSSAFGYGTPLRSSGPFTRSCGLDTPCPGSTLNETCETRELARVCVAEYESRIPADLIKLFSDGAATFSPTVSSIFDMQYRTYRNSTDPYSTLSWYTRPDYRTMSVLVLEDKVILVEGLVVDLKSGGIGFRNHTAPSASLKYGATWKEDLLFIEPETQCVPLNISIDVVTPAWNNNAKFMKNVSLVDHGGFSGLTRPGPDLASFSVNGRGDFDLRDRAFRAGWVNNYLTMLFLNLTDPGPKNIGRVDSIRGQRFPLGRNASDNFTIGLSAIQTNVNFGSYLNLTVDKTRGFNPHNVSASDFDLAATTCGGTSYLSPANINSTLIACGLVHGAATRTDGGDDLILDPETPWTIPLYSCATAMKAVVKTVEFQYNGTGFDALRVRSLAPKEYPDPASVPTWGVEDVYQQNIDSVAPMWGIVGPNATGLEHSLHRYNITTLSRESLYLPGFMDQFYILRRGLDSVPKSSGQNLPGVEFYNQALLTAYTLNAPGYYPSADYSGASSLAMYAKWQRLSQSAAGAASIINLVWTDVAANAVVGTKGWGLSAAALRLAIPTADGAQAVEAQKIASTTDVPVTVYTSRIRYRIPFAIPAFVILGLTALLLGLVLVLLIMRRTGLTRLRLFLESTSVGRILSPFIQPAEGSGGEDSKDWIQAVGDRKVTITTDAIMVDSVEVEPRGLLNESEPADKGGKSDIHVDTSTG